MGGRGFVGAQDKARKHGRGVLNLLARKPRINRLRGSGGCFTQVRGGSGACFEYRVKGLWGSEAGVSSEKCSEAEISPENAQKHRFLKTRDFWIKVLKSTNFLRKVLRSRDF